MKQDYGEFDKVHRAASAVLVSFRARPFESSPFVKEGLLYWRVGWLGPASEGSPLFQYDGVIGIAGDPVDAVALRSFAQGLEKKVEETLKQYSGE
ncbi:hypothetical protein C4580_02720 [Candidatus Woesearchaeota archaeon]|nr:MAG: hypothetical protein C4580_02720 [Candidatus Woesearchaeota archaeon]